MGEPAVKVQNDRCRFDRCGEDHRHPITGAPPDYHYTFASGVMAPRWRNPFKNAADKSDWLYSTKELALMCGVCLRTVQRWIWHRGLPVHRAPGIRTRYMVKAKDFERWLKGQEKAAYLPTEEPK